MQGKERINPKVKMNVLYLIFKRIYFVFDSFIVGIRKLDQISLYLAKIQRFIQAKLISFRYERQHVRVKSFFEIFFFFCSFLQVFQVLDHKPPVLNSFLFPIIQYFQRLFLITLVISTLSLYRQMFMGFHVLLSFMRMSLQYGNLLTSNRHYIRECIFFFLCEILMFLFNVKCRLWQQLINFRFFRTLDFFIHSFLYFLSLDQDFLFFKVKSILFVVHTLKENYISIPLIY